MGDSDLDSAFDQHVKAREVPLFARDNLGRAKRWISECLASHRHCREFQDNTVDGAERPTRVLEVTATSARLRCDMADQDFEYLALSHMWGENHEEQLRLLEKDLASFQKDIPWDRLCASSTFKEAIRVTCTLGYRYLWIDSLCIIQDSKADWHHEAGRMAIVYGNATCNIACLFPPNTTTTATSQPQPKTREDPRGWNPCILRAASPTRQGLYVEYNKDTSPFSAGQIWLQQETWPLFHRAWTFQEYLLAPRTLLVGHQNLMFQCSELFCDELLGVVGDGHGLKIDREKPSLGTDLGKSKYFPASIGVVAIAATSGAGKGGGMTEDPAVMAFVREWWIVVNEYRARKLSFATDRVIAFAGIARAYAQLGRLTYLAGVWYECLALSLMWYIDKKPGNVAHDHNDIPRGELISYDAVIREDVVNERRPEGGGSEGPGVEGKIPSWSWFSVPIYAFHDIHFAFADELSARRKHNRTPQLYYFDAISACTPLYFQFSSLLPPNTLPTSPQAQLSQPFPPSA
ncbi:hypothetical protein N0V83_010644 [Neocucurbitaria cava]|uniref:Heterokaryon incompatibility domain-containing protein n=1 Tax=Neocucurbitaria cava TaxID=798079 RepID=A0A9W9CHM0_9PLEO|nr:hypothetical protein N0V83_010644 [Neocucurbitaria cava]